jgi:preprotein translocase subunit SecG
LIVQILVSISIVTLVLLQQGKGADMGAGFGSGASGTVFGARGSGSFLTRATAILATVFFVNCLLIASPLIRHVSRSNDSVIEQIEQQNAQPKTAPPAGTAAPGESKSPASDMPEAVPESPPAGQPAHAPATESSAAGQTVTEKPAAANPAATKPVAKKEVTKSTATKSSAPTDKKKVNDLPE